MISEALVEFETAKLLKEAGFPQEYAEGLIPLDSKGEVTIPSDEDIVCYTVTQAQAMRWLREYLHFSVRVNFVKGAYKNWFWDILNTGTGDYIEGDEFYPTYEEAAEAGIQAACRYLAKKGGKK